MKAVITTGVDPFPHTVYYEDGEQVWPCRCGETHRGDYGGMDWLHHECFHEEILLLEALLLKPDESVQQGLCIACGEVFKILRPNSPTEIDSD